MKHKLGVFILGMVALMTLSACGNDKSKEADSDKLQVVTTFYPMYDFSKQVVGEKGNVSMLITGETEPHDYEPSAKDIAKIQEADVFVYNSDEMETWVPSVLKSIDTSKVKVIKASQGIKLMEDVTETGEESESHTHSHGVDPHVWLDPVLAQAEVQTIAKAITELDQENSDVYKKQAKEYQSKLAELDRTFSETLVAAKNRDLVTQHAAFGYLAARYDLHQVSISGISPDQEPSPTELAKIEDFVKKEQVHYIYTEELASTKIAKTIASATGAELLNLNTLEGLSKAKQEQGADYLSVMKENLEALSKSIK
ncbi:metal ABC transporter substrate-binding protein [Vagococcus intermedius]|uniref:Metal ABC transporter substrate-binding protein n=1 Tax=Vagococcus intermedius TaxID=2991418 RepID=A0AAF0I532_9ENTE|nr:metal ABC transporter substrate-binding protein [Vagococcus intermedius]WEG72718.1 metal ABC transporter substrate-binding protein [Vagococcus intermedius]WEG74804.1 metal ABC transporter substrate-binding protein [Vagococcus intermedius]